MLARALVAFVVFGITTTAHAGAWLQPHGEGLVINQLSYYSASKYFDADGELRSQPRFSKYEFQPYVEYGVFDNVTIGGSAYAQRVNQSGRSHSGIADPEIFGRVAVWQDGKNHVAVQPLIKFNGTFDRSDTPRGGSTSTDFELSVLYGRALPVFSPEDYVDARIGYRVRNHGLSDQVRFDVASGFKFPPRFEVVPAVLAIMPMEADDTAVFSENGDLDYSLVKAEVTGIYHLNDRQWLQATLFKHLYGAQTGNGYGLSLGAAQRF